MLHLMTLKSMLSTHILVGILQLMYVLRTNLCYITNLTANLYEYQSEISGYTLSY
jgi:hypothetical protein